VIHTTLVLGATGALRETAIAQELEPGVRTALILEGMPDGQSTLCAGEALDVARIAAGCPCCIGNLTMRVTLHRLLRRRPERLFIALATSAHVEQLRDFLARPPYKDLLLPPKELHAVSCS
jgi:G3E family GTPase